MLDVELEITSEIKDTCTNMEVTNKEYGESELVSEIVDKVFSQFISQRKSLLDEPVRKRKRGQISINNMPRPAMIYPIPCQLFKLTSTMNCSYGSTAIAEFQNSRRPRKSARSTRNRPCNQFGSISGIPVGSSWSTLNDIQHVHGNVNHCIHGHKNIGAYSLLLSTLGGPEGRDDGEQILLCVGGSMKLMDFNCDTLQGHKKTLALNCNAALNGIFGNHSTNWRAGKPIRVIRSSQLKMSSVYAPAAGFRYDGVYKVCSYERAFRRQHFFTWLFMLRRDDELPTPWDSSRISINLDHNYSFADGGTKAQLKSIETENSQTKSEGLKKVRENLLSRWNHLQLPYANMQSKRRQDNCTMENLKTEPVHGGADVQFSAQKPSSSHELVHGLRETEELTCQQRPLLESVTERQSPNMAGNKAHLDVYDFNSSTEYTVEKLPSSYLLYRRLRTSEKLSSQPRLLLKSSLEESPSNLAGSGVIQDDTCVFDSKTNELACTHEPELKSILEKHLSNHADNNVQSNVYDVYSKANSINAKPSSSDTSIRDSSTTEELASRQLPSLEFIAASQSSDSISSSAQGEVYHYSFEARSITGTSLSRNSSVCGLQKTEKLVSQQQPVFVSTTVTPPSRFANNSAVGEVHYSNLEMTSEKQSTCYSSVCGLPKSDEYVSRQPLSELESVTGQTKSTTDKQVPSHKLIRVPQETDAPLDIKPPLSYEYSNEEELSTLKSVCDSEETSERGNQSPILESDSEKQPLSTESVVPSFTTSELSCMQPIVLIPKFNENQSWLRNHTANEIEQMLEMKSNLHRSGTKNATSISYSTNSSFWTRLPQGSPVNETRKPGHSNVIKLEIDSTAFRPPCRSNDTPITGSDESNTSSPDVTEKQSLPHEGDLTLSRLQPIVLIPRLDIDQMMPSVKEESIDADLETPNPDHSATIEIRKTVTSGESEFNMCRKPTCSDTPNRKVDSTRARAVGRAHTPKSRTQSTICACQSSKLTSDLDALASDSVAVGPALLSNYERIVLRRPSRKQSLATCSSMSYGNKKICVRRTRSGKSLSKPKIFNGSDQAIVPDCDGFKANLPVTRTFNTETATVVNIEMEVDCNHPKNDFEGDTNEKLFSYNRYSPMVISKIEENAASTRIVSPELLSLAKKDEVNRETWDYLEFNSHNDSEFLKTIELIFTCPSCDNLASVTLPCQHNACSMCLTTRYLNKVKTCPYPYCCGDISEILHKTNRGDISVYENWDLKNILRRLFPHRF